MAKSGAASLSDFQVRFWGVRGSYPVPGPKTLHYGGNTPCLEIIAPPHHIIMDAGTGIVELGEQLGIAARGAQDFVTSIFISHTHHDHIQGFPFFRPAYVPNCRMYVFGPRLLETDLQDVLSAAMIPPLFPVGLEQMNANKKICNVTPQQVVVFTGDSPDPQMMAVGEETSLIGTNAVIVRTYHSLNHPKGGVFIYRIERNGRSCVYATDVEGNGGGDVDLVKFVRHTNLLIHDSQYQEEEYASTGQDCVQGYGHSTPMVAINMAREAEVERLVLFHHNPEYDDDKISAMGQRACQRFTNTIVAREGLVLDV